MNALLGTAAYSTHVQNVGRALLEVGWLGRYETGAMDVWRSGPTRRLRRRVGAAFPGIDRELSRRAVTKIPHEIVRTHWGWEGSRAVLGRLPVSDRVTDWIWERGEHALGRHFASLMRGDEFDLFVGVEHGALEALQACRDEGKPGVVMFLSPHHAFLRRWMDPEVEAYPELLSPADRRIRVLNEARYARKDEEMRTATLVRANSALTARGLVEAGVEPERLFTVPLGCPPALDAPSRPGGSSARVIYAGPLSVRKGFHYLLDAWRRLRPSGAELHAYGALRLPERLLADLPDSVVLHGSVPRSELMEAYERAHLLAFPTLCDGFGMVVSEALSRGVPVLTTPNAGAADLVRDGVNGFLVPAAQAEPLAACLDECLSDPERLVGMRSAALETARSWTWADFRREFVRKLASHLEAVS